MANNYTLMSTFYPLEKGQSSRAAEVMGPALCKYLRENDYPEGCIDEERPLSGAPMKIEITDLGVWFAHEEDADPGLVANLVSALQKAFSPKEGGKPFVFSYCYACSKPRVGEFGGGAYAVLPDGEILHSDPRDVVLKRAVIQIWKKAGRKNWWELKTKVGRKNWWEVKHE